MMGYGFDEEEEEEELRDVEEERVYKFFLKDEPKVEALVAGLKIWLPVSKLGLSYKETVEEASWDTFETKKTLVQKEDLITSSSIKLDLLTITGNSKRRFEPDKYFQDLESLTDFEIVKEKYFEEINSN